MTMPYPNAPVADALARKRWIDDLEGPCEPQLFMAALDAFHRGADIALPQPSGPGLYLTDIPMNRAGLAGVKFLRAAGVQNPQAYLWRIIHFGQILRAAGEYGLAEHVRADEVSCALIRAAAVARIVAPGPADSDQVFDMADVAAKTAEFAAAEEAAAEEAAAVQEAPDA